MADTTVNVNGTIANDAVTNAKLANMPEARVKMRAVGAGTGDPIDGTADELSTLLDTATDPFLRTSDYDPTPPLAASQITDDSDLSGPSVKDSLNELNTKDGLHDGSIANLITATNANTSDIGTLATAFGALETDVAGKANTSHTHALADITDCTAGVETAYTGTDTYTAGTQPSGTVNKRQFYTKVGNMVTWQIMIAWQNSSATCTNATLTFPTEFPTPAIPTGFTGASVRIWQCFSTKLLNTTSGTLVNATQYMISRNAANNGFEIMSTSSFASGSYRVFIFGGTYYTQ